MPLFDISTALSCELVAANQLAARLSEADGVQNLAETTSAATALESITIGIAGDPFDSAEFTLDELENRHFFVHIYAEPDEGFASGLGPEAMGVPKEGGAFRVYLRRQVRESEDRTDAYNFFWDRISSVPAAVLESAEELAADADKNRFAQVTRPLGPEFGTRRTEGDQGDYLFAEFVFTWGDVERE